MTKQKLLLSLFLLLGMVQGIMAQEPYAALSDDNTVLTFYYDTQKAERNGMSVGPFEYVDYPTYSPTTNWYSQRSTITTVVFDASFADCTSLTSTACWFYDCYNLTTITGIENLKTDNVTDMSLMFEYCHGLTSLDVSGFKTDNVTDMGYMFSSCYGLTSLDVSGFKTDNVTNMSYMFRSCSGLTSLDVSGFKTDNVTDMGGMFYDCSGLTSLDVSGFKTDNVTEMSFMFSGCSGLTSLGVSGFKTDNVTDMSWMFYGCSGLTSLDVSGFKTDNVTDMSRMFYGCKSLTSLDVSGFKTDNVTDMRWMFPGCSALTSLDVSGFKTDNVTDMSGMFYGCSSLTSLDVSGFKTDNVVDMSYMFWGCSGLATIYADETKWSTDKVTSGGSMFTDCTKLVGGNGTTYNDAHTDHEYARIDKPGQPGYFTEKSNSTGIARNVAGVRIACHDRMLTVTGAEGASCQIYDLNGRELTSQGNMGSEERLQLPAADVYLVHIRQRDGQKAVYKIQAQ